MKQLLVLVLIFSSFVSSAQNTEDNLGELRLFMSPTPETITLDNVVINQRILHLKPGKYFLQAWAPDKKLLDTIIEVKSKVSTHFFYRFEPSANYRAFQTEYMVYEKERNRQLAVPVTVTALMGVAAIATYAKGNSLRKEVESKHDDYIYSTPYNLENNKIKHAKAQDKYRPYIPLYYAELAGLAIGSYFIYRGIKKVKSLTKPTYQPDENPLALTGMGISKDRFGNYTFGITLNLN